MQISVQGILFDFLRKQQNLPACPFFEEVEGAYRICRRSFPSCALRTALMAWGLGFGILSLGSRGLGAWVLSCEASGFQAQGFADGV